MNVTQSASCTMSVGITGSVWMARNILTSSTSTRATYTMAPLSDSYAQLTVTARLYSLTASKPIKIGGAVAVTGIASSIITAAPMVAAVAAFW